MMKITAITQDQILIIDGVPVTKPWCSYTMPAGEWALHYDTATGVGEVEYLDNRPNEAIDATGYAERYQHLEQVHADAQEAEAAHLAEMEAQATTEPSV